MKTLKFMAWDKELNQIIPVHNIDFNANQINTNSAWRMFNEVELIKYLGIKDINGSKIFNVSIVSLPMVDGGKGDVAVFVFDAPNYYLRGSKGIYNISSPHNPDCYEVIGNIYEGVDGKPWQSND